MSPATTPDGLMHPSDSGASSPSRRDSHDTRRPQAPQTARERGAAGGGARPRRVRPGQPERAHPADGVHPITPTSVPYAEMRPEDIVTVDLDGRKVHGALDPSSETPVHILTYRARPGVGACIHVEPPYVNALGVIGAEIPNVLGNFVYLFGGRGLAVVPCLHSGTEGFAQASVRAMGDRFGAVWKNHGLFCVGQDIGHALNRCIAAEQAARVYYLALVARAGEI